MLNTADDLRHRSVHTNEGLVRTRVLALIKILQSKLKARSKVAAPPWSASVVVEWFASTPPEQIAKRLEIQLTHMGYNTIRETGPDGKLRLTAICEAAELEPPVVPPKPKAVGLMEEVRDAIKVSQVNVRRTGLPVTSLYPPAPMTDIVSGAPRFDSVAPRGRGRGRKAADSEQRLETPLVVDPSLFRNVVANIPKPSSRNS